MSTINQSYLVNFCHNTFFKNCSSKFSDQSLADVAATEATAISTPFDNVPLYSVPIDEESITLLKSSQAVTSSVLLRFGIPETKTSNQYLQTQNSQWIFFCPREGRLTRYKCFLKLSTQSCCPRSDDGNLCFYT